jgi:hypothetical protein
MVCERKAGPKHKNHAQDGGTLIATDQRPAILPWLLSFGWRPSFRRLAGILPAASSGRIAVGRHSLEHGLFESLPVRLRVGFPVMPSRLVCSRAIRLSKNHAKTRANSKRARTSKQAQRRMLCFSISAL